MFHETTVPFDAIKDAQEKGFLLPCVCFEQQHFLCFY